MLTLSQTLAPLSPGDSLLHRLDPRTKLLMFPALSVAAAAAGTYAGLLLLLCGGIIGVYLARPGAARLLGLLKLLAVLMGAAFLLNALFTPGTRLPGPSAVPFWPTDAGLGAGLAAGLRLASVACFVFSLVATTSPRDLSEGADLTLGRLAPFRGAGVSVNVAFRFLPEFIQEAQRMRLIRSLRRRGQKLGFKSKLLEAASMMLALIVIAVRKAERIADAMTARCYQSGAERTAWRPRTFTLADGTALGVTAALCVSALILGAG